MHTESGAPTMTAQIPNFAQAQISAAPSAAPFPVHRPRGGSGPPPPHHPPRQIPRGGPVPLGCTGGRPTQGVSVAHWERGFSQPTEISFLWGFGSTHKFTFYFEISLSLSNIGIVHWHSGKSHANKSHRFRYSRANAFGTLSPLFGPGGPQPATGFRSPHPLRQPLAPGPQLIPISPVMHEVAVRFGQSCFTP